MDMSILCITKFGKTVKGKKSISALLSLTNVSATMCSAWVRHCMNEIRGKNLCHNSFF